MTDALSAASLLLAMIALVFGAWWPRLGVAASFRFSDSRLNRKEERGPVWDILMGQAVPLALGAVLGALVFLPRAWGMMGATLACGCADPERLDDVAAAFVVSAFFLILIAVSAGVQTVRIAFNLVRSYV